MRKEKIITLHDREGDLTFRIREMPVTQLESWICRGLSVLSGAGAEIPEGESFTSYFARNGLKALGGVDYAKAKPLLDELLACAFKVNGKAEEQMTDAIADACIGDVGTLLKLRVEIFNLHFGFLTDAVKSGTPAQ